jgi:hypothetical protein
VPAMPQRDANPSRYHRLMEQHRFDDADSLSSYVTSLGKAALYRGQTTHYEVKGAAVIKPSQHRKGCVPSMLRAWTHHIIDSCRRLSPRNELVEDVELMQALLQHYGWRSFYIDATDSIGVAAWFAGSAHNDRPVLDLCTDSNGDAIALRLDAPNYIEHDGSGHLYVISRDALVSERLGTINLAERVRGSVHTRFIAQSAWLIGAMPGPLPPSSIIAHVEAPGAVMRELARRSGFVRTEQLFPARSRDAVLEVLLSSPWQRISLRAGGKGPTAYARRLPLPEYDYAHQERRPASEAFVTPFWIADQRANFNTDVTDQKGDFRLNERTFFRISEDILYVAKPATMPRVPKFLAMLKRENRIIVESDGLIRLSDDLHGYEYDKGVSVELVEPNVIEVSALVVDHPGARIAGAGVRMPWFYSFDDNGNLQHIEREGQCTCKDPWRHRQHIEVLGKFEYVIDSFVRIADRDYEYRNTKPVSIEDLMRQSPR